jgi:hypothetical protein
MSYYIIPKTNRAYILPHYSRTEQQVYISRSLFNYYNKIKELFFETTIDYNFEDILKNANPFEFLYSKVPGTNISVSKLIGKSNTFYDFTEIIFTLNIFDDLKNPITKTLHITPNYLDTIECINTIYDPTRVVENRYNKIDHELYKESSVKYDFIFIELFINSFDNLNGYIFDMIKCLYIIMKKQSVNGTCIIKIDTVFHKPIIDVLYILSSMYEKVYMIKPTSSNIATFEKYIVCMNFITYDKGIDANCQVVSNILLKQNETQSTIFSLVNSNTPLYFTNKLDDINIIIGQQQLDFLDQLVNIYKTKNKADKLETIRKANIQKSIGWCEKFKIPCNKFHEKINMFLPLSEATEFS